MFVLPPCLHLEHDLPRFFFKVVDGSELEDPDGVELPDINAAKCEAVMLSGALLKDIGARFWDHEEWRVEVRDESGLMLFMLQFIATEAPALRKTPMQPVRSSERESAA